MSSRSVRCWVEGGLDAQSCRTMTEALAKFERKWISRYRGVRRVVAGPATVRTGRSRRRAGGKSSHDFSRRGDASTSVRFGSYVLGARTKRLSELCCSHALFDQIRVTAPRVVQPGGAAVSATSMADTCLHKATGQVSGTLTRSESGDSPRPEAPRGSIMFRSQQRTGKAYPKLSFANELHQRGQFGRVRSGGMPMRHHGHTVLETVSADILGHFAVKLRVTFTVLVLGTAQSSGFDRQILRW